MEWHRARVPGEGSWLEQGTGSWFGVVYKWGRAVVPCDGERCGRVGIV